MHYVIMFGVCIILGLVYALRTQSIIHDRAYSASLWTAITVLLAILITTHVVKDAWQLIPVCLGQALGTFIAMKIKFFQE